MRSVAALGVTLVAAVALAQEVPPPFATTLGPGAVRLEVDDVELTVVLGHSLESQLRAWAVDGGFSTEELLDVRAGGSATVTRRAQPDPGSASPQPRLRLQVEMASGQRLQVQGRELAVRITPAPLPDDLEKTVVPDLDQLEPPRVASPPASGDARPVAGAPNVDLALDRSTASLNGVSGVAVIAVDSNLHLSGCLGASSLEVHGGVATVEDQRGPLTLAGHGAELTVAHSDGQLTAVVAGGSLLTRDGLGPITARLEEGLLQVDAWRGALDIKGTGTAEVRRSAGATLNAAVRDLRLLADGWSGPVNAELDGGEIRGGDWSARATVTLRGGATAAVDGVRNNLTLRAEEGCTAHLRNVAGKLDATANGARLDARGVGVLSLLAVGADVTVTEVGRVEKADAARSTLDLDLTGIRQRTVIGLARNTTASIRVSTPCQVRTQGPGATLGNQARVSGCEHRIGNQAWMTHPGKGLGGERPIQLHVAMAESARVEVTGGP